MYKNDKMPTQVSYISILLCTVYIVHCTLYSKVDHLFSELTGSLSI